MITFDKETIRLITIFENLTNTIVKDCIFDRLTNTVYYIVEEGKIGLAIGKNGSSVKNAEKILKKNIKIFEFSKDLKKFVKNLIPQANEIKIKKENGKTIVEIRIDKSSKAFVIGREKKNIKFYKEILRRNHGVSELIVK